MHLAWLARFPILVFYVGSLSTYVVSRWVYTHNDCLSVWRWGNFVCEVSETSMRTAKSHLMSKTLGALGAAMTFLSSSQAVKFLDKNPPSAPTSLGL
jgi:hypothetical protein